MACYIKPVHGQGQLCKQKKNQMHQRYVNVYKLVYKCITPDNAAWCSDD